MGSQFSKEEDNVTFSIKGNNLNFSDDLIKKLEDSNETDFSRDEESQRLLEVQVGKRLNELEKETLKKFESKIDESMILTEVENDPLTSDSVDKKIDLLNEKLSRLDSFDKEKLSDNGKEVRDKLLRCLVDNKGKPLNCYEYMEAFRKLVK